MLWKKYIKIVFVGIQSALEYRMDTFLLLISCFFPILIQIFMWTALFEASEQTVLFNYTYSQMLLYVILATIISKIISADYCSVVAEDIKSGELSKYLIKPVNYFSYIACKFMGDKIINISVLIFISVIVLTIFILLHDFIITISALFLFVVATFMAMVLKFMISYLISCISFWFTESDGILLAMNVVGLVISGAYFPLDIFGPEVVSVLRILPFYYTIYFSVNIFTGVLSISDIMFGLLLQLTWIIILRLCIMRIWSKGLRLYIAVGN